MGKKLIIKGADYSVWEEMHLENKGMSIVNGQAGYIVTTGTPYRICGFKDDAFTFITIPAGKSMAIRGLKGESGTEYALRFDYVYGTCDKSVIKASPSSNLPGVVGTASNYVATDYFPINTDGEESVVITNNYGSDYNFAFLFAGPTKNESLTYTNYTIKYRIF